MARTLLVLRPTEDRSKRLWVAEDKAKLLSWLRSVYLPGLHGLDGTRLEISQNYHIPQPTGDYNFVVRYQLPQERQFWPWSRYATFWFEREVIEDHTLPVSLGSLLPGYEVVAGEPPGGA